ncbi:uncharacterized protein LOC107647205 [Arachis ipaensis]|uniref:uncharacterized protein LOC107647205 n=1 Tax=Arachis ipaensis TaxID=130454 RepID=UPI000A2B5C27|nr:uncharacterized protein LOC107647205 [Arachis ipaensis]
MMSPNKFPTDRGSPPQPLRQTPLQIIHVAANFMRIWSIYFMYRYLTQSGASIVLFLFACIAPAAILFLILQKPWKGRPLSNTQVVPSIINGAITALYFVLWGKGLRSCGPIRAILSKYSGAVLGVLSALLYGRKSNLWKKIDILIMGLKYYLSQQTGCIMLSVASAFAEKKDVWRAFINMHQQLLFSLSQQPATTASAVAELFLSARGCLAASSDKQRVSLKLFAVHSLLLHVVAFTLADRSSWPSSLHRLRLLRCGLADRSAVSWIPPSSSSSSS